MSDPIADIRRELLAAAVRQTAARRAGPTVRAGRRGARRRIPALAVVLLLIAGGVALAATQLLGRPVPSLNAPFLGGAAPGSPYLLSVRAPDPAGGLPWGMRRYVTSPQNRRQPAVCLQFGRVSRGTLGVLGQDGVFADDGLFHALPVQPSEACFSSGDGQLTIGPEVLPASGYRFVPVPARLRPGGCVTDATKRGAARQAAMVRQKIKRAARPGAANAPLNQQAAFSRVESQDKITLAAPTCPATDLRTVLYGVVAADAKSVQLIGPGINLTEHLKPADQGGFIFVLPLNHTSGDALRVIAHA